MIKDKAPLAKNTYKLILTNNKDIKIQLGEFEAESLDRAVKKAQTKHKRDLKKLIIECWTIKQL